MRRLLIAALALACVSCSRETERPAAEAPARETMPPGAVPPPTSMPPTALDEPRAKPLPLGSQIPASVAGITLASANGPAMALGQARHVRGLLVVFTCNTCPYARAWEARLVALGNQYQDLGLGVVFINANDPKQSSGDSLEAMAQRVKDRGYRFPYLADAKGTVARAFGAARTPEAFVFDAAGTLVYHGTVDDNAQDATQVTARWLQEALAATVSAQPVPLAETKALGCAIKLAPLG